MPSISSIPTSSLNGGLGLRYCSATSVARIPAGRFDKPAMYANCRKYQFSPMKRLYLPYSGNPVYVYYLWIEFSWRKRKRVECGRKSRVFYLRSTYHFHTVQHCDLAKSAERRVNEFFLFRSFYLTYHLCGRIVFFSSFLCEFRADKLIAIEPHIRLLRLDN